MSFLFWIFIGIIGGAVCYWLMDWHDKHGDGE
jgi:uncharacterized membrane protein YeaQ/YmgE (transglycosylase-associated protein family)